MLKVYLDWNVITHLKDEKNKEILSFLKENRNRFVFPYSLAHLKDLLISRRDNNPYFDIDLDLLTFLSGTHLLEHSTGTNSPYPYSCTPREYIESKGDILDILTSEDVTGKIKQLFSKYNIQIESLLEELTKFRIPEINLPQIGLFTTNLADILKAIMPFANKYTSQTFADEMKLALKNSIPEEQQKQIMNSDATNVLDLVNSLCSSQIGKSFVQLIAEYSKKDGDSINSLSYFEAEYVALNFLGFRSDKKRSLANIYADAEHAYYALSCDIFVTNDGRLSDKSSALYQQSKMPPKVISTKDLIQNLKDELLKEYDIDYFFDTTVPQYGIPSRYEQDKAVYKMLPYRFWGIFNYCFKQEVPVENTDVVLLKCHLHPTEYIYFTELQSFFSFIKSIIIEDEDKSNFEDEYVNKFMTRKYDIIKDAQYTIVTSSLLIQLVADPDSFVPLPMVFLSRYKQKDNQNDMKARESN